MTQTAGTKRSFLKVFLGGGFVAWIGAVFYPLISYLRPPLQAEVEVSSVRVGMLKDIPKESGTIIRFGTKPVIVVRGPGGEVKAFNATCTHLDCTVQYKKEMGVIWCACHNGKYDLAGRNIAGPPPRPLDEFRVVIQGDEVFVSRKT
jgi:cytochrome b6-f complex iron-sulfur subunit